VKLLETDQVVGQNNTVDGTTLDNLDTVCPNPSGFLGGIGASSGVSHNTIYLCIPCPTSRSNPYRPQLQPVTLVPLCEPLSDVSVAPIQPLSPTYPTSCLLCQFCPTSSSPSYLLSTSPDL